MKARILCVDDDQNILNSIKRSVGRVYDTTTTTSAAHGLEVVRKNGPFSVILSDMRMPEMDGVKFICEVHKLAPDTVCMMLTGNLDQETAAIAVNKGQVFRFLTKPCHHEEMLIAIEAGVRQHQLVISEKELLHKTLTGSIRVLANALELASPKAFAKGSRIKPIVKALVQSLQLDHAWQYEIAAMLSQIGCITIPPETIDKIYAGKDLNDEEKRMYIAHPKCGARLLAHIPRLDPCAEMIAHQLDRFDSDFMSSQGKERNAVALGAQIIHAAVNYELHLSNGLGRLVSITKMKGKNGEYNPDILDILEQVSIPEIDDALKGVIQKLTIEYIVPGMYAHEDILTSTGTLLVSKGNEITPLLVERLRNFAKGTEIKEPISVLVLQK